MDLAGNRLTADGIQALATALPSGSLTSLILSANAGVGPRGAAALAAVLPSAKTLTTLRLDGCCIGPSPCGRLAAALTSSTVAHLDLSSNEIGDLGAAELAWRLPDCASLERLGLAVNEIEEDGATELLDGLKASTLKMQMMDLRGNRIDGKGATCAALLDTGKANVAFQRYVAPLMVRSFSAPASLDEYE